MSEMEYNRGKLIPVEVDTELFSEDDFETYRESGFEVIDGEIYEVQFDVRRGDLDEISRVSQHDDGTIYFETYHHNGAAYWAEVVEQALAKKEK